MSQYLRAVAAALGALVVVSAAGAAGEPEIVAKIQTGLGPCASVAGFGSVWVTNYTSATLSRVDPATNRVRGRIRIGAAPCGVTVGAGSVWIDGYGTSRVERVNPRTMKVVRRVSVGVNVWDVAYVGGAVWASNNFDGAVVRINPKTNRVVATLRTGGRPAGFEVAFGSLWVGNNSQTQTTFFRIDPASNRVTRIDARQAGPAYFAATEDALWVISLTGSVTRVDPRTNAVVRTIPLPGQPGDGVAAPDGTVWIPIRSDNTVARLDPATDTLVGSVPVGRVPFVLGVAFGDVWVPSFGGNDVWRFRVPALARDASRALRHEPP